MLNRGITFERSDRSRSLSLAPINNLGSNSSLKSIAKITRCLQVFVLTSSFLSIRFTRKVYALYNAVFRLQYSECIMFKCHILLYVKLNKMHVYMYSCGIVKVSTIFRYGLIDRLCCNGIENSNLDLSYRTCI